MTTYKEEKTLYVRKDIDGSNWCSTGYMSKITGLNIQDCYKFLTGPERSKKCGLQMTSQQASLFCKSLLTREAEHNAGI